MRPRVIPVMLLKEGGLVKSVKFKNHYYIGDPINAVRVFNEKEVDELIVLDIDAAGRRSGPDFAMVRDIAEECFMPLGYGGGITTLAQARQLISIGVEKIILGAAAARDINLVREISGDLGSQSVVVCVDVAKKADKVYEVKLGKMSNIMNLKPIAFCRLAEQYGAGEIILQSVDRDGTYEGYDLEIIREAADSLSVPLIACGGAGNIEHFREALKVGAAGVAAGSLFVYYGKSRGVLINYLHSDEVESLIV